MNRAAGAVGGKRPAPGEGQYAPRKRPAGEDDDMMEEDFDMEPPEDELDDVAAIEVRAGRDRRGGADGRKASPLFQQHGCQHGPCRLEPTVIHLIALKCPPAAPCRWMKGAWGRRARTGRAHRHPSSTPQPTTWVRALEH